MMLRRQFNSLGKYPVAPLARYAGHGLQLQRLRLGQPFIPPDHVVQRRRDQEQGNPVTEERHRSTTGQGETHPPELVAHLKKQTAFHALDISA